MKRVHNQQRSGYAMMAVLLVLVSLLFLVAPFLATVSNADKGSRQRSDVTSASLALDDAARLAKGRLGGSHPAHDGTPYFDSEEELRVVNDLDPEFLYGTGEGGARWDLESEDLAGRIDLDSAAPAVLANLMELVTRLTDPLGEEGTSMKVSSTAGFAERGVLWINGELIGYGSKSATQFKELSRGLGAIIDDGETMPGPQPARAATVGTSVMDQRAVALPLWRIFAAPVLDEPGGRRSPRSLGSLDRLVQVGDFVLDGDWDEPELTPLMTFGSVWANYGADPKWMAGTRINTPIVSGETMSIGVEDVRWFAPGTTVRIQGDGVSELALVRVVNLRRGTVYLDRPLVNEQLALGAVAEAMARRAVNVNTATLEVLEALFVNLQLSGRNARITRAEARQVGELIIESRPLSGFQDLLERVVMPAANLAPLPLDAPMVPTAFNNESRSAGMITQDDALALYRNALCANDAALAYSTMPLRFTSRDVYSLDLRVSVTAQSGIERLERVRDEVHRVTPQGELLRYWSRQEDFDDELRLSRNGRLWNTGPNPTGRRDAWLGSSPPSRFDGHLGTKAQKTEIAISQLDVDAPMLEPTFADRESEGWIQSWPSRVSEAGPYSGHMMHFDSEPETNTGRDLKDRPLSLPIDTGKLSWKAPTGTEPMLRPITFSAWVRPKVQGGYLLDLAGGSEEVDRISLLVDGDDLVLRVLDGAGDHPYTSFKEVAEVRHSLNEGAGLPADTWSHIFVDVRGTRPDQMLMMVDARPATGTPGLTKLTQSLSDSASLILVESTDGFPDVGVLRIGYELIEYTIQSATAFSVLRQEAGQYAGFGGRLARERFFSTGVPPLVNAGLTKTTSFFAGTAVELYGYSIPTAANVSSGGSELKVGLGKFSVAIAVGVEGGAGAKGDEIVMDLNGTAVTLGYGLEGDSSAVTGLILAPADSAQAETEMIQAFSQEGGYAVIAQLAAGMVLSDSSGTAPDEEANLTVAPLNTPLFRMEVVHYTGHNGNVLQIDRRGSACQELALLANTGITDSRAFVTSWVVGSTGPPFETTLSTQVFVVPISVPADGGGGILGFPIPAPGKSEYAQLTRLTSAELTEWIRYDEVIGGQLVRSNPLALLGLGEVLSGGVSAPLRAEAPTPPGGGGPPPVLPPASLSLFPSPKPAAKPAPKLAGSYWGPEIGVNELEDFPVSNAVQSQFRFRGVLGTYSHAHYAGTEILPVFRLKDRGETTGYPGRLDGAFFMDYDTSAPAWPVTVHRAYRAGQYFGSYWEDPQAGSMPPLSGVAVDGDFAFFEGLDYPQEIFVAMQQRVQAPIVTATFSGAGANQMVDQRATSRLVRFPTGERPRLVDTVHLGQDMNGEGGLDGLIDEAAFISNDFGGSSQLGLPVGAGEATLGSSMVLAEPIDAAQNSMQVEPYLLRWPGGVIGTPNPILSELNANSDCGLLRIGNELIAYGSLGGQTGSVVFAVEGRGMLGTSPQNHAAGEEIFFIDAFPISQLAGPVSADDSDIELEDYTGFSATGLMMIGEELIHHTRSIGAVASMPRASETPGARDGLGGGAFRARFGTQASTHQPGVAVIGHPFRFWDRWSDGVDEPELSFFGFEPSEQDAYWRSVFWNADYERGGAYIGMLLRTDSSIPWDADPDLTDGLYRFDSGAMSSGGNPLNFQSDQVETRMYVGYQQGSFDAIDGLSHGWKQGPRVRAVGFEMLAPGAVFERVWK